MAISYGGDAETNRVADAGLGVKGGIFYSSCRGGCSVMWMGAVSVTWMSGWRLRDIAASRDPASCRVGDEVAFDVGH